MKLLFIASNRLGDAVLSTGLLAHLVEGGNVRTCVICGPVAAGLFEHLPGLERVLAVPKKRLGGHWWTLWRRVAGTRWDLIVDLRASPLSFAVAARRRRTFFKAGDGHRLEDLAAWYGLPSPAAPRLWSAPRHAAEAAALLPGDGPVLGLAPTANWRGKVWPAERFAALAAALTAPGAPLAGARVAVFGGPGEEAMARPTIDGLNGVRTIDLVGDRHPMTVAEALRRCRLVVSNDSGPMHLAAAAGAPTLGLFGPSRAEHYAPWGPRASFVTTGTAYDDLFPPGYDRRSTGSLMTSLGVEAVEREARALLERT